MEKFLVKLTGPDNQYPARASLKVNDSVKLFQDANNQHSPNAVKITMMDNTDIGFVAETKDEKNNTRSARDLFTSFGQSEYVTGIVIKALGFSRGGTQFIVDVNINPMTNSQATPTPTAESDVDFLEMVIGGARSIYKELAPLTTDCVTSGGIQSIKVVAEGSKLIAEYNGGKAGTLKVSDSTHMFGFDGSMFIPNANEKSLDAELFLRMVTEFSKDGVEFKGDVIFEDKKLIAYIRVPKSVKEEAALRFGIGELLKRVVDDKILTAKQAQERLKFMQDNGFDEDLIKRVFDTMCVYDDDAKKLIPERPESDFIGQELIYDTVFYAVMKKNLGFEGGKGRGKNHLAEQITWLLNRPLLEVSLNVGADNSSLLGTKSFDYGDTGRMEMSFDPEPLIKGAEMGAIVVLDEMNTSLANIMSVANSLLDKRRRITVPGYKHIVAHPNFNAISTYNPDYVGTMEMNEATAERFVPIVFDGDVDIQAIVKSHFPKVTKRNLELMEKVFQGMEKLVRDGMIEGTAITIRGFEDAAESTLYGKKLNNALVTCVANRAPDKEDRKALKNLINDSVGSN